MIPTHARQLELRGKQGLALALAAGLVAVIVGFAVFRGLGGTGLPTGAIAFVDGAPEPTITAEQVAAAALRDARLQVDQLPAPGEAEFERFQDEALSELILARWVAGEAEEVGIEVAEADIAAELETFVDANFDSADEFERFKQQAQLSDDDFAELTRLALIGERVNALFAPGAPNTEAGYDVPDSLIEAYYEQNRFLYELVLGDPTDEPTFATVDQVRELIITSLRPGLTREFVSAARTDFTDKWRARTICAPGFTVERCRNGSGEVPDGAPPVISASPVAPGLAGLAAAQAGGRAQTPYPQPAEEGAEAVPPARDSDTTEGPDTTPQLIPPPSPAN